MNIYASPKTGLQSWNEGVQLTAHVGSVSNCAKAQVTSMSMLK